MHPVGAEFVEAEHGQGQWVDGAFRPARKRPPGFKHELYLMRSTGWMSQWIAGAKDGFVRLGDKRLNKALQHAHEVHLGQPRPTHKLAKVLALMKWAVKCWTDADCAAVIRRLVGLQGPKHRPSLPPYSISYSTSLPPCSVSYWTSLPPCSISCSTSQPSDQPADGLWRDLCGAMAGFC